MIVCRYNICIFIYVYIFLLWLIKLAPIHINQRISIHRNEIGVWWYESLAFISYHSITAKKALPPLFMVNRSFPKFKPRDFTLISLAPIRVCQFYASFRNIAKQMQRICTRKRFFSIWINLHLKYITPYLFLVVGLWAKDITEGILSVL